MKVSELVEKLLKLDQEATVLVTTDNFEMGNREIEAKYVSQYDTGQKRTQGFRDAFDGGSYSVIVWSTIGGKEKVVTIR